MAQTTYDETNSELHNAYVGTAQESMEKAAHEICAGRGREEQRGSGIFRNGWVTQNERGGVFEMGGGLFSVGFE